MIVIVEHTMVNGQDAEWSPEILKEFEASVMDFAMKEKKSASEPIPTRITVERANYFEPRPYRNEYDQGSDKRGFTWTVRWPGWHARDVVQSLLRS